MLALKARGLIYFVFHPKNQKAPDFVRGLGLTTLIAPLHKRTLSPRLFCGGWRRETIGMENGDHVLRDNPLVRTDCQVLNYGERSMIRTCDFRLRTTALCPLSYAPW